MSSPKVSIIIPSFNEGEWLARTVRGCLEKTNYPDFEVVVVADGCTDGSVEQLHQYKFPNLKLIELPKSQGAIVARNRGAERASGDVLVFIDSHQEPMSEAWLQVLTQLLEKPKCGAATINIASIGEADRLGYLYALKDWTLEPTWQKPKVLKAEQLTGAIPGGCFAIKKSIFNATGGFNPCLQKWGREDFEYSLRLWRLGYDLWFSPKAVMGHAFNHKRQFKISWEQVDFNILWVAHTLMDEEAQAQIHQALQKKRPQNFKKVTTALQSAPLAAAQAQLDVALKRGFAAYREKFVGLQ